MVQRIPDHPHANARINPVLCRPTKRFVTSDPRRTRLQLCLIVILVAVVGVAATIIHRYSFVDQ
jgi:hypothetical protein